jgi:hypothetical protein
MPGSVDGMNGYLALLLSQVIDRLQQSVRAGDCPAIVVIDGRQQLTYLSDYDYLRDDHTAAKFEERAAAAACSAGARQCVLGVPQVWVISPGVVSVRAVSNLPLRPGESEAITWTAIDLDEGIDYGRVVFTRRPDGEPVFAEAELITRQAVPALGMPGYTMLHAMLAHDADPEP